MILAFDQWWNEQWLLHRRHLDPVVDKRAHSTGSNGQLKLLEPQTGQFSGYVSWPCNLMFCMYNFMYRVFSVCSNTVLSQWGTLKEKSYATIIIIFIESTANLLMAFHSEWLSNPNTIIIFCSWLITPRWQSCVESISSVYTQNQTLSSLTRVLKSGAMPSCLLIYLWQKRNLHSHMDGLSGACVACANVTQGIVGCRSLFPWQHIHSSLPSLTMLHACCFMLI